MEFKDYYRVLGVERDASQDDIKRAYRRMARKYHPDVSQEADASERFKEVGEAYEVLKDPEKRAAYDQLGRQWQPGEEFRPPPDWDAGFAFSGGGFTEGDMGGFSDFFETLFGHGFSPGARRGGFHAHGEDRHARIEIDLEDSYRGASHVITLRLPQHEGHGRVTWHERKLNVTIPKGVAPGQHIRLAGQGEPGMGEGRAGDLYLEVVFRPHLLYRLEGRDVLLELPVAPWEAALGGPIKVPTPKGSVEVKIPANATHGSRLRLKGRGLPSTTPGDFLVVLKIVQPKLESEADRDAYRRLAEHFATFKPRARLGG
ncbi:MULTISPECIES: DnaJ C-terminal domain-containing protein [Modicisalibacter]|uniref:DnaJ C-terminal domain-containing protein n=1 Tax=Modicisalibacter TaxID=574347 RepID=UPI00100AB8CD|nr:MULTISPECIES: DnaJ C-terminal domain-containing protein [Halomonadaceae]MBZ9557104.1 DnaJ domain-containing protein [Modicisalibacter sp. R2A 31.J]MBZ9574182.1 DnaJ domain-containing protein [Modicisalibacter sp. MOD 31.J]